MNRWFEDKRALFENFARRYFSRRRLSVQDVPSLMDAVEYSFFSGGKRFRPLLCHAVAETFGLSPEKINGFALAVECVHTYSLIHDDLPCMDDGDMRRGRPTTHKKFSENLALLAGDSLLTESFVVLTRFYPDQSKELIERLACGCGLGGMIRGQVLDLGRGDPVKSLDDLIKLHRLKTGELMAFCFQGPFVLASLSDKWMQRELMELGLNLGLSFQIKDDLLDFKKDQSFGFVSFLGEDKTHDYFQSLNRTIGTSLKTLGLDRPPIKALVDYNEKRDK